MKTSQAKKALLIGVNKYHTLPLRAPLNDVQALQPLLELNADGTPNFSTTIAKDLTGERLKSEVEKLLHRTPEHALLYYSGHGCVDKSGNGYLVGKDFSKDNIGMSMEWLADKLNNSNVPEITVILDCCHADAFGMRKMDDEPFANLRKNVTILAATTSNDTASEGPQHGFFTALLLNGFEGAAANMFGHVTAAGLYDIADSMLSPWHQRPVFKSYITHMSPLRTCSSVLANDHLKRFRSRTFFKDPNKRMGLTPDRITQTWELEKESQFFSTLLKFQLAGLIECDDDLSVYQAALQSRNCQLSPYGKFVWDLLNKNRL